MEPPAGLKVSKATGTELHDRWLPLFVTALYRLTRITHAQYQTDIKGRINNRPKALGMSGNYTLDSLMLQHKNWVESPEYCRVIAGIDMFLYKFSLHAYREVRLGTKTTRYQDCAGIHEVVAMSRGLGMQFTELALWMCTDDLADEMIKLCQTGQEIEVSDSYAPYFMAMKLAQKSKYSVTDNPNMHLFAGVVGCSRGTKRSKNAIMTGETATDMVLLHRYGNACILAYAAKNFGPLDVNYTLLTAVEPRVAMFCTSLTDTRILPCSNSCVST